MGYWFASWQEEGTKQKRAEPAGENDATAGRPEFPPLDFDLRRGGGSTAKRFLFQPPAVTKERKKYDRVFARGGGNSDVPPE